MPCLKRVVCALAHVQHGKQAISHCNFNTESWLAVSPSAVAKINDILFMTTSPAKLGYVLTVKDIVNTDVNLGSGCAYKVLIQEAMLIP